MNKELKLLKALNTHKKYSENSDEFYYMWAWFVDCRIRAHISLEQVAKDLNIDKREVEEFEMFINDDAKILMYYLNISMKEDKEITYMLLGNCFSM